jgi:urea transport system permease protein
LFALGGLFVFVTLFLPKGIVGTLTDLFVRKQPSAANDANGVTPAAQRQAAE